MKTAKGMDPYLMPPKSQAELLKDKNWRRHFLAWVTGQSNPNSRVTPGVIEALNAFNENNEVFSKMRKQKQLTEDDIILVHKRALDFIKNTIVPLDKKDKKVHDLVIGYNKKFSIKTLLDSIKDIDSYKNGGDKVFDTFCFKISQSILGEYSSYLQWLQTSEAKKNYPLRETPIPKFEDKNNRRVTDKVKAKIKALTKKAEKGRGENIKKAEEKLKKVLTKKAKEELNKLLKASTQQGSKKIGKEEEEELKIRLKQELKKRLGRSGSILEKMQKYIAEAPLTINFKGTHKELDLYEKMGARTSIWSAPKGVVTDEYLDKRQTTEEKYFGFRSDAKKGDNWRHRPVYTGVNLGNFLMGAAEEYGHCYMVLKQSVKTRVTYSHKDTYASSGEHIVKNIGTPKLLEGVIADMDLKKFEKIMDFALGKAPVQGLGQSEYLEGHVHGMVDFKKDVERIVVDRSEVPGGSRLDEHIKRLCKNFNIKLSVYDRKKWTDIVISKGVEKANESVKPSEVLLTLRKKRRLALVSKK